MIDALQHLIEQVEQFDPALQATLARRFQEIVREALAAGTSGKAQEGQTISKANREAFLSAAGAWEGIVDTEQLKEDIYMSRSSDRPAVEL